MKRESNDFSNNLLYESRTAELTDEQVIEQRLKNLKETDPEFQKLKRYTTRICLIVSAHPVAGKLWVELGICRKKPKLPEITTAKRSTSFDKKGVLFRGAGVG